MVDFSLQSVSKRRFGVSSHSVPPTVTIERAWRGLARLNNVRMPVLSNTSLPSAPGVSVYNVNDVGLKFNSWGKGLSSENSQASALMEFIERFSSENPTFDQDSMPRLSSREELPSRSHSFDTLGAYNFQHALYGDDLKNVKRRPLLWSKAYSLTYGEEVWLPSSRIWVNFSQQQIRDYCCTNGFSANNTREEAILQGLCEIVERHTLHLHFLNQNRPPMWRIPSEAIRDSGLREALHALKENGWVIVSNLHKTGLPFYTTSVWMHNPTSDYQYRTNGSYIHFATACSVDTAVSRCLTECVQSMSAEKIWRDRHAEARLKLTTNILEDLELRLESPKMEEPAEGLEHESDDFRDDIECAVSALASLNIEVLVADCTHSDLAIPVVRVICPTLQPNFLLHRRHLFHPMAIVTRHVERYQAVWDHARTSPSASV